MAHITVDGKMLEVREGALLIEELLVNHIAIPHFCYHPSLGKDGNCRMCMVEIEGQKRPQIACDTPIKEGMVVRTRGSNIERIKRSMLELELINHPIDCPICDQAGECELQNYYMDVGLYESRLKTPKTKAQKRIDLGSNVILDQERCVLCTRCVRFFQNITKTSELGVLSRGDSSVISTFPNTPLSSPYSMNIVDLCPVGALTSKDFRFRQRVWFLSSQEAICDGCAKGCALFVDYHRPKYQEVHIYRYRPRLNAKVNGHFICDAGRLGYPKENESKLLHALIRGKNSEYEYAEGKLLRLIKRHSSKTLMVLSPNLSLEEMVRLQKLAKVYDMALSGYHEGTYDEAFGDDFLRQSERSCNAKGFELLGISTTQTSLEEMMASAELIILVGHRDNTFIKALHYEKSIAMLSAYQLLGGEDVELVLPIASHMARAGSFINSDNMVQYSACEIPQSTEHKKILALVATILGDHILTCKEVWDEYLSMLCGADFEEVQKAPFRIEL